MPLLSDLLEPKEMTPQNTADDVRIRLARCMQEMRQCMIMNGADSTP